MMLRVVVAVLIVCVATSGVTAQKRQAEKLSPEQVHTAQSSTAGTLGLIHSPWIKFCGKGAEPGAKLTCLTVKEARLESGQFVAGAALHEQADKRLLRVTLPLGMQLMPGVRMFIDTEQPATRPYFLCLPNGCMAEFEVNADFVGKLKKGQQLQLQGINMPGQVASYLLPLGDFAKAFDGPPTDAAKFERAQREQQQRLEQPRLDDRLRLRPQ